MNKNIFSAYVLLISIVASASPYDKMDKTYKVTCGDRVEDLIITTSSFDLENDVLLKMPIMTILKTSTSTLANGEHSKWWVEDHFEIKNQKKLVRSQVSDDFPVRTKSYIETRFAENQILMRHTDKTTLSREILTREYLISFDDGQMQSGTIRVETYWPKKNNVELCQFVEER